MREIETFISKKKRLPVKDNGEEVCNQNSPSNSCCTNVEPPTCSWINKSTGVLVCICNKRFDLDVALLLKKVITYF